MIKHCLPVDYDFPFASGLHSLNKKGFGCSVNDIKLLCVELTEGYHLPVELLGEVSGVYYLRVPKGLSEVRIDWIYEIIKYHTSVRVQIILVESNEDADILLGCLQLEYDIQKEIHNALARSGNKVKHTDSGIKLVREALDKVLEVPHKVSTGITHTISMKPT